MKQRIVHVLLAVAATASGALAEAFTAPDNAWSHLAWAPLVGVLASWVHHEIDAGTP